MQQIKWKKTHMWNEEDNANEIYFDEHDQTRSFYIVFFMYVEYQHVNMIFAGMSIVSVSLMVGFLFFSVAAFSHLPQYKYLY